MSAVVQSEVQPLAADLSVLLNEHRLRRVPTAGRFSREEIIASLRAWAARYGETPCGIDWDPARARLKGQEWRAQRFEEGKWPTLTMVRRQFGTWTGALLSAGLRPNRGPVRPRSRTLSDEEILAAIRRWTRRHGEPPAWADWSPARARRQGQEWRVARYLSGDWPSSNTVVRRFGTFSAAVEAAGETPRPRGRHTQHTEPLPERTRLALAERFAADELGSGPGAVAARVRGVAEARAEQDARALRGALIDLASAALAWADVID